MQVIAAVDVSGFGKSVPFLHLFSHTIFISFSISPFFSFHFYYHVVSQACICVCIDLTAHLSSTVQACTLNDNRALGKQDSLSMGVPLGDVFMEESRRY